MLPHSPDAVFSSLSPQKTRNITFSASSHSIVQHKTITMKLHEEWNENQANWRRGKLSMS